MTTIEKEAITVETTVKAPVQKVWKRWTDPAHIVNWNFASPDWHSPEAENDLREGGRFRYRMESRDGSMGFDFTGSYQKVVEHQEIHYTMDDGRHARITFTPNGHETKITETFEAENSHSSDMQRQGWQAILDNFKQYAETPGKMQTMHFEIEIDAPAEKVYRIMLADSSYREWTTAFCDTSYYEGRWENGEKIHFIGVDEKGNKGGMVSRVKEIIPSRFVSIEHLGVLENDTEITSGPQVEGWAGALENYTFTGKEGKTLLGIDLDVNDEFRDFFTTTWPKALDKLKAICEA